MPWEQCSMKSAFGRFEMCIVKLFIKFQQPNAIVTIKAVNFTER